MSYYIKINKQIIDTDLVPYVINSTIPPVIKILSVYKIINVQCNFILFLMLKS